jgi:hypothetical protein
VRTVEIGHGGGIDVEVGDGALWVSTKETGWSGSERAMGSCGCTPATR